MLELSGSGSPAQKAWTGESVCSHPRGVGARTKSAAKLTCFLERIPMRMIWFRACCVLAAVGSVLFVSGCSDRANSADASRARATTARIYTVAEETTRRRVQAAGSLFALEESTLSAEVEGRVEAVLADVGDTVKDGQPLIELDRQELQFEVDRQRGLVRQVRAQLGIGPNDPPPADSKKTRIRADARRQTSSTRSASMAAPRKCSKTT